MRFRNALLIVTALLASALVAAQTSKNVTSEILANKTLDSPRLGTTGPYLKTTVTTLTDAQIKALPTTPITLATAPGSNRGLVPIRIVLDMDASAGAYTNVDTDGFLYVESSGGNLMSNYVANSVALSLTYLTDFLGTTPAVAMLSVFEDTQAPADGWGNLASAVPRANMTNASLQIEIDNDGSGDLTGGNAANSLVVTVVFLDLGI